MNGFSNQKTGTMTVNTPCPEYILVHDKIVSNTNYMSFLSAGID